MTLVFGLSLDGYKPRQTCFNHQHCGPEGLIKTLELRLGLAAPEVGNALRVSQYREAAEQCCEAADPFFKQSLTIDRWGTAAALLSMRDTLRMAGWDGTVEEDARPRLQGLAALEEQSRGRLAPGLPDRLASILTALPSLPIERRPSVISMDREEHLPWLLRCLLGELNATFTSVSPSAAAVSNNLSRIQAILSGASESLSSWDPDDSSVIIATAHSEITMAEVAARLVRQAGPDTAVISSTPMALMAETVRGLQTPAPATRDRSPHRPTLQLIRLVLEMRWEPPDPSAMLAFLRHPSCPVNFGLRKNLASAVCKSPGIGSKSWTDAIDRQKENISNNDYKSEELRKKALDRCDQDLKTWIEIQRYDRRDGAPGAALAETMQILGSWASKRASTPDQNPAQTRQLRTLTTFANELERIFKGMARISDDELAHALELVLGQGTVGGNQEAQLKCAQSFSDPGAVAEPYDTVIWHGFEHTGDRVSKDWTGAETQYLQNRGIHLQTPGDLLACHLAHASRPILAATQRVVLLCPREKAMEPVHPHPLLTRLKSAFPEIKILDLDKDELPEFTSEAKVELTLHPLPKLERWIRLPKNLPALPLREKESFSSISKLIYKPFEWLLSYHAKIRRADQMNAAAQRGNLLHAVVERLFDKNCEVNWLTLSKPEFDTWLNATWLDILKGEGANFLLPGGQIERQRLLEQSRLATWSLLEHLRNAGVTEAIAEDDTLMPVDLIEGARIGGRVDLIARTHDDRIAVIDLKYGQKKNKEAELKSNTALQLAVYSQMVKQRDGSLPAAAYFILLSNDLLAQDSSFFNKASVQATSENPPDMESTWLEFLDVLKWRRQQIADGWLEVPIEGTSPSDEEDGLPSSIPPHPRWKPDEMAKRYDSYQFLAGLEEPS